MLFFNHQTAIYRLPVSIMSRIESPERAFFSRKS